MAGNICRCGTYARIRQAIHLAASGRTDAMAALPLQAAVASAPGAAGPPPAGAPVVPQGGRETPTESLNVSANPKRPK
jgi:hypothetical protein